MRASTREALNVGIIVLAGAAGLAAYWFFTSCTSEQVKRTAATTSVEYGWLHGQAGEAGALDGNTISVGFQPLAGLDMPSPPRPEYQPPQVPGQRPPESPVELQGAALDSQVSEALSAIQERVSVLEKASETPWYEEMLLLLMPVVVAGLGLDRVVAARRAKREREALEEEA